MIIAIILARGGSKRLPRKNILPLAGLPMVAWSIKSCLEANLFDRVLVSTDDPEIADLAIKYGAAVPFLRDCAADDHATSSQATLAALSQAESYWGEEYSVVSQLMANCPFRTANDIVNSVDNFYKINSPSQISVFRYGWMNPWWAATLGIDGQPSMIFPEHFNKRSQDLPTLFCPTGAFWIADAKSLKKYNSYYMDGHSFFEISWKNSVDIDDFSDFEMAEALAILRDKV